MRPVSRRWWLFARTRAIPFSVGALTVIAVAAWAASDVLAHPVIAHALPVGDAAGVDPLEAAVFEPGRRVPVVAAAPLLVVLLFSGGLAGADPDLEQATPVRWSRWRLAHLLGITTVSGAVLAATVLPAATTFGTAAMVRNVIGYAGLTALSVTVIGAALAWAPPLVYAAVVYLAAPRPPADLGAARWWAWPMQPGGWDASWICALLIGAAGIAAYARYGSRHATHLSHASP